MKKMQLITLDQLVDILENLKQNDTFDFCAVYMNGSGEEWYGFRRIHAFDADTFIFNYYGGGCAYIFEHIDTDEFKDQISVALVEDCGITEIWVEEKDLKRGHS